MATPESRLLAAAPTAFERFVAERQIPEEMFATSRELRLWVGKNLTQALRAGIAARRLRARGARAALVRADGSGATMKRLTIAKRRAAHHSMRTHNSLGQRARPRRADAGVALPARGRIRI
jgi:hypothetical protein